MSILTARKPGPLSCSRAISSATWVFLLGSWLDEFYGWARRYMLNTQIALLARRGRLLPWPARALIWLVIKGERNLAID